MPWHAKPAARWLFVYGVPACVLLIGCGKTTHESDPDSENSGGQGGSEGEQAMGGGGGSTGASGGAPSGGGGNGGSGVGGAEVVQGPQSVFEVEPAEQLIEERFFDHPWPSDWRRDEEGWVALRGYPNPRGVGLIDGYVEVLAGRVDGFSPVATGYLRFTAPLDPDSLPRDPQQTLTPEATVQLINVSVDSAGFGQRAPVALAFRQVRGVYIPENTLSFRPLLGQPLLPATRYALVVSQSLLAANGDVVEPAPVLEQLLEGSVPDALDIDPYVETVELLPELGVDPMQVMHLAVFTTADPTRDAMEMRDHVLAEVEAPSVAADSWQSIPGVAGRYQAYEGRYGPSPDYQHGTPPFGASDDGGAVERDAAGQLLVAREFELRFALSVPEATPCPAPADGYPVVLVLHGTGGNYLGALGAGREADVFGAACLATLTIDQIYHGERPGSAVPDAELLYFNLQNPLAARSNGAQSAIDFVQLARLVKTGALSVPAAVNPEGAAITFDPERILMFGHSQGGLNGPIVLAVDDQLRGGVFSGAAATIGLVLLQKQSPLDFTQLLGRVFLGLAPEEEEELDLFHPALSLVQLIADPSDPVNYADLMVRSPRLGFAPKSVLMLEGVRGDGTGDTFAPPRAIETLAAAIGLPPRAPTVGPMDLFDALGLAPVMVADTGGQPNLAGGTASGALLQFDADLASDGHFVFYEHPPAAEQSAQFLRALADDPAGALPGP